MFIMLTERTDYCKKLFEKKMSFEQYEIFQEIFKSINFFDTPVDHEIDRLKCDFLNYN